MKFLRYLALLGIFALPFAVAAPAAHAQVAVGIGVGVPLYAPPACAYGYYGLLSLCLRALRLLWAELLRRGRVYRGGSVVPRRIRVWVSRWLWLSRGLRVSRRLRLRRLSWWRRLCASRRLRGWRFPWSGDRRRLPRRRAASTVAARPVDGATRIEHWAHRFPASVDALGRRGAAGVPTQRRARGPDGVRRRPRPKARQ